MVGLFSARKNTVLLSGAGVQRSGTPAESKHPYPGIARGQGFLASVGTTVAGDEPRTKQFLNRDRDQGRQHA